MEPQIYTQSIEDIEWKNETFDFIGFFQVLEHIVDPESFLKCVYNRLSDSGKVFLEVPNLYDPLRVLWNVPAYETFYFHEAHLSYFSEMALKRLLNKCGFGIEKTYYIQDYNLFNNLYWYFNNAPQKSCKFGLDEPHIAFRDFVIGDKVNAILKRANDEYFKVLSDSKLTANIFIIAKKLHNDY